MKVPKGTIKRCKLKSGDEFECGIMVINWADHEFTVEGIGGHNNDLMTPKQVRQRLLNYRDNRKAHIEKHGDYGDKMPYEVWAVVAWKENADGYQQLCHYDLADFENEVYGPE